MKISDSQKKAEKDGKSEMESELQYLIVSTMSVNDFLFLPPSKKTKAAIGSDKATNYVNISDDETLFNGAASAAKLMERMTAMSLKISSGKLVKSFGTLCPTINPHRFG